MALYINSFTAEKLCLVNSSTILDRMIPLNRAVIQGYALIAKCESLNDIPHHLLLLIVLNYRIINRIILFAVT
jgi:hypothetical protein